MRVLTFFRIINQYFTSDLEYYFAGINLGEWHWEYNHTGINFREHQKHGKIAKVYHWLFLIDISHESTILGVAQKER